MYASPGGIGGLTGRWNIGVDLSTRSVLDSAPRSSVLAAFLVPTSAGRIATALTAATLTAGFDRFSELTNFEVAGALAKLAALLEGTAATPAGRAAAGGLATTVTELCGPNTFECLASAGIDFNGWEIGGLLEPKSDVDSAAVTGPTETRPEAATKPAKHLKIFSMFAFVTGTAPLYRQNSSTSALPADNWTEMHCHTRFTLAACAQQWTVHS